MRFEEILRALADTIEQQNSNNSPFTHQPVVTPSDVAVDQPCDVEQSTDVGVEPVALKIELIEPSTETDELAILKKSAGIM
jgi:hypothetical protein